MRRQFVEPSIAHPFDIAEGPFVYHPSDLRVALGGRIHDEQMPTSDVGARGAAVGKLAGDVAPHDVEALHDSVLWERGAFANYGRASVACDDEVAAIFARTVVRVGMNADHAIFFEDEIAHGDTALELEAGEFRRFGDNHFEHRGLRHNSRRYGKAVNWKGEHGPFAAIDLDCSNWQIWQGVELLTKSGLVNRRDSRGHQEFAAKLAREISLPFEQSHWDVAASEHVGEQGACGSGTDDDCGAHFRLRGRSGRRSTLPGRRGRATVRAGRRSSAQSRSAPRPGGVQRQ